MSNKKIFEEMKQFFGVDSLEDAAEKLGYSRTTAATWRSRGISNTVLLKFNSMKSNDLIRESPIQHGEKNLLTIPALELKASAGGGNHLESIDAFESYAKINVDKMLFKTAPTKNMRAIQVDGYSMAPMLMPDSWVIFELDRGYDGDGLYIINWRNVLMVKKIQLDMGTGKFNIISANPDYDSYSVDPDDQSVFRIVGKVIRAII